MSEAGFIQFQNIAEGIGIILYACCMAVFFDPFMEGKNAKSGGRISRYALRDTIDQSALTRAIKMLIVFLAYAVLFLIKMAINMDGWICMVAVIALLTMASPYLRMDRQFAFFLGVLFFCIRNLCTLALTSVNFYTDRYFVQGGEVVEQILRNVVRNFCLVELLHIIFFSGLLYIAGRQLKKCRMELHMRELCYLLLTPATAILFVNILFRMLLVVSENQVFQLYVQYPALSGIVPLAAALFYAGILVTIVSYQKMLGLQEERKKYFVEQQQVHALQERMEEVEQFYDGIRRMKHEMRNHLTNIKGLLESGSYGEMERYIARMDESMAVLELAIRTGNAVTDVIVNDKRRAADRQGIAFRSEFTYPISDRYNAYDIGIIVNNLLQNALEACGRMAAGYRYISVSSRQKKKFFLIEVKNSYEGEIAVDTDTNLPISTKEKDILGEQLFLHGIGLSNVKREAEKYMGDVDIKAKKNEFIVTVLLQERSQA